MKAVFQEKSTHIHAKVQWSLFTTEVENWTSNCTQLYFVESIRKHFVLTDKTGSCCNGGLHSLFTSCNGLRPVFWTLSRSRNVAVTTQLHCEVDACNVCMYSDPWKYVSGSSKFGERFLCCSHILALIFVDLWGQVVWIRLWHQYYRIICANVGKKPARNSAIFHHRFSLFTICSCRFCSIPWSDISFRNNFFHSGIWFWHKINQEF